MKKEKTRLEICFNKLAFIFFGKSVYKPFADRLPIEGVKQALDFGCGIGTVAYYAAGRLPEGKLICLDISARMIKACRKTLRKFNNVIYLRGDYPALERQSFDLIYCHFVLHDIEDSELERVIPALACSLKAGGKLVFREPLNTQKISLIRRLIEQNRLILKDSRVTDVPLMGNALESIYNKEV